MKENKDENMNQIFFDKTFIFNKMQRQIAINIYVSHFFMSDKNAFNIFNLTIVL